MILLVSLVFLTTRPRICDGVEGVRNAEKIWSLNKRVRGGLAAHLAVCTFFLFFLMVEGVLKMVSDGYGEGGEEVRVVKGESGEEVRAVRKWR